MYLQSDTLLLADIAFGTCLEVSGLDTAHFLSVPGLTWQEALKKIKVKLYLLTNIDMLLMVEKGISQVKFVMLFIDMAKLNAWKIMMKRIFVS